MKNLLTINKIDIIFQIKMISPSHIIVGYSSQQPS